MKRAIAAAAVTLMLANGPWCAQSCFYPDAGIIVGMDYETDTVSVHTWTSSACGWQPYTFKGCEDYSVGDAVAMIMHNAATPETCEDDKIIRVRYSLVDDMGFQNPNWKEI